MCLIVFAWRPDHAQPLIVAANRDEFYARPSLPLAQWPEAPHVHAGRDLEAGGSWLGIGANGRFAALTNIRDPHQPPARKSRGELVAGFLAGDQSLEDYLADVVDRSPDYAGFNLLLGNHHELWHFNARMSEPVMLESGGLRVIQCRAGYTVAEVAQGQGSVERGAGRSDACAVAGVAWRCADGAVCRAAGYRRGACD